MKQLFGRLAAIINSLLLLSAAWLTFGQTALALTGEDQSLFNRNIYWYDPKEQCANTGFNFSGDNNRQIVFNFFVSQGLTPEQSAGVTGNLLLESAGTLDPKINQGGGGPGRGIAQWSVDGR